MFWYTEVIRDITSSFRKGEILLLSATTYWEDVEKIEPDSLRGAEQKDVTQWAQVRIWEISI